MSMKSTLKRIARHLLPPVVATRLKSLTPNRYYSKLPERDGEAATEHGSFHYDTLADFRGLYRSYFKAEHYKFSCSTQRPFIIDGGANIGVGCRYWKHLHPDAEVVAFEPDKLIFELLEKNMQGVSGFKAHRAALWSADGELVFNAVGGVGGHVASVGGNDKPATSRIVIPSVRLRDRLQRRVNLLKLDIEGAEMEVLRDCADSLHNVERIFVEHHSFIGKPQHLSEFFGILENAGFRINVQVDFYPSQPFASPSNCNGKDCWLNVFGRRV